MGGTQKGTRIVTLIRLEGGFAHGRKMYIPDRRERIEVIDLESNVSHFYQRTNTIVLDAVVYKWKGCK
jgi:hypothetical protein